MTDAARNPADAALSTDPESARVLVLMGVSGCGKSTIAQLLADELGWDFGEGDSLHPQANVDKMHSGTPLTDEDRWPWLELVSKWIRNHLDAGRPGIITCSALKRSYRDVLRAPGVVFVLLHGSAEVIAERMKARKDHFMPPSLLQSQLATLEIPGPDENAIIVDLSHSPTDIADEIAERLGLRPARAS